MLATPTIMLAQTSSQDVTLTVSGSNLIKVMNKDAAGPAPGITSVSLSLSGATEAGAAINPVARDTSTRLRMSCLTANTEKRKITAVISSLGTGTGFKDKNSNLSLGLLAPDPANQLNFTNYADANDGVGTMQMLANSATGQLPAVTLVQNMTTSWTGTSTGDGYMICYEYTADAGKTPQSVGTVQVTFTIGAQ